VITESTVINEYIEDVFPDVPLRPEDPYERAHMRIWSKFVDEYFCPALSMIGWHVRVRDFIKDKSKEEVEQILAKVPLEEQKQKWATIAGKSFTEEQLADSRRRLKVSMQRQEERLQNHKWLAGDTYSLADINTYPMTAAMPRLFGDIFNEKDTPRSIEWLQAMHERPAVKAALAMARYPLPQPAAAAAKTG
jgi:glutathione S-transferase